MKRPTMPPLAIGSWRCPRVRSLCTPSSVFRPVCVRARVCNARPSASSSAAPCASSSSACTPIHGWRSFPPGRVLVDVRASARAAGCGGAGGMEGMVCGGAGRGVVGLWLGWVGAGVVGVWGVMPGADGWRMAGLPTLGGGRCAAVSGSRAKRPLRAICTRLALCLCRHQLLDCRPPGMSDTGAQGPSLSDVRNLRGDSSGCPRLQSATCLQRSDQGLVRMAGPRCGSGCASDTSRKRIAQGLSRCEARSPGVSFGEGLALPPPGAPRRVSMCCALRPLSRPGFRKCPTTGHGVACAPAAFA